MNTEAGLQVLADRTVFPGFCVVNLGVPGNVGSKADKRAANGAVVAYAVTAPEYRFLVQDHIAPQDQTIGFSPERHAQQAFP